MEPIQSQGVMRGSSASAPLRQIRPAEATAKVLSEQYQVLVSRATIWKDTAAAHAKIIVWIILESRSGGSIACAMQAGLRASKHINQSLAAGT